MRGTYAGSGAAILQNGYDNSAVSGLVLVKFLDLEDMYIFWFHLSAVHFVFIDQCFTAGRLLRTFSLSRLKRLLYNDGTRQSEI